LNRNKEKKGSRYMTRDASVSILMGTTMIVMSATVGFYFFSATGGFASESSEVAEQSTEGTTVLMTKGKNTASDRFFSENNDVLYKRQNIVNLDIDEDTSSIKVLPGESFSSISLMLYGDETHWVELAAFNNKTKHPSDLSIGERVYLPTNSQLADIHVSDNLRAKMMKAAASYKTHKPVRKTYKSNESISIWDLAEELEITRPNTASPFQ
jgi:hypothetical protein